MSWLALNSGRKPSSSVLDKAVWVVPAVNHAQLGLIQGIPPSWTGAPGPVGEIHMCYQRDKEGWSNIGAAWGDQSTMKKVIRGLLEGLFFYAI